MIRILLLCFLLLPFLGGQLASQSSEQRNESKIAKRVLAVSKTHPRLFMDAAGAEQMKKKIAGDPLLNKAMAFVRASADAILSARPVVRKKVGRRLLGVSRTCLKRVVYLAFTYRMTGEARYFERAEREMLAAAGFSDWNPGHFLDVAEMTAALAIGYDWLYEGLSPGSRKSIRRAIVEKGLETSMRGGWWVSSSNNWNQVCHGGLSLGALAVLEDEPELATRILKRAVRNLPRAMKEYSPDGAYPEGPGYWNYGTTYNVLLIDALQSVFGTDFGLSKAQGFLQSSDYYQQVCGPTGLFFNYSDCGAKAGVSPAMYWFATKRHMPSLLWQERAALERKLAKARPTASNADRALPFLLIWTGALADIQSPKRMHWKAAGRVPVGMHRSTWGQEASFVAIKGGSPSANHAHMDIGSFVMDSDGVRWASDLGAQSYQSLESKGIDLWNKSQKSERWTVFRLNSFSHNTLVVDGRKQGVRGSAPIIGFAGLALERGRNPHTIVDLSRVYRGQLAGVRRGVALLRDLSVLIQDEVETLDRETTLRWGMVTRAKVERIEGGQAWLSRGGKQLRLRVLSPDGVKLEIINTAKPRAAYDQGNPGTRMIGFQIRLPASTRARLRVQLIPGSRKTQAPKLQPLANW